MIFKAFWPWIIQFCAAEISYLYNICRVLELNYAICMVFKAFWPWIPCLHRARSILEPASWRGLSAAFRVICSILSRVSFWIYFRLVRVYLGDQRMRRVKDQDEEGKRTQGPGDQGTRGPQDQRTRGPEDQGQRIRGTWNCFSSKFIFFSRVLDFFPGNLDLFSSIIPFAWLHWIFGNSAKTSGLPLSLFLSHPGPFHSDVTKLRLARTIVAQEAKHLQQWYPVPKVHTVRITGPCHHLMWCHLLSLLRSLRLQLKSVEQKISESTGGTSWHIVAPHQNELRRRLLARLGCGQLCPLGTNRQTCHVLMTSE